MRILRATGVFGVVLMISGCMNYYVIPTDLDEEVDRSLTLSVMKTDPELYEGKTVVLGGIVLGAKNLKDGVLIEVLHLPLSRSDRPIGPSERSQGRFLVLDPERRDPAVLQNRRITLVGQVIGKKIQPIDEADYTYLYLKARFIHIWPVRRVSPYAGPYPYPYYYYPAPYPYGFPPYWYYGGVFGYYGYPHIHAPGVSREEDRRFGLSPDKGTPSSEDSVPKSDRKFKR